jgi:hypothetical protein
MPKDLITLTGNHEQLDLFEKGVGHRWSGFFKGGQGLGEVVDLHRERAVRGFFREEEA